MQLDIFFSLIFSLLGGSIFGVLIVVAMNVLYPFFNALNDNFGSIENNARYVKTHSKIPYFKILTFHFLSSFLASSVVNFIAFIICLLSTKSFLVEFPSFLYSSTTAMFCTLIINAMNADYTTDKYKCL